MSCKRKWANLVRTYKVVKDHKKKTGRESSRFMFFEQLDALLGDTPTNASPHTIDVARIQNTDTSSTSEASATEQMTDLSIPSMAAQRRKNPTAEYIKYKKKFYEEEAQQNYQHQQLQLLQERNAVLRGKSEIERKKLDLLERFIPTNVNK